MDEKILIFKTFFGHCALLYTEKPFSIFKTFLPRQSREDLMRALSALGQFEEGSHGSAREVSRSIIEYFQGRRPRRKWPPWEWVDLGGLTSLQRSVLRETAKIPYGKQRAYRDIAAAIGHPNAFRFVGSTLAKNPLPLLIPCHRVVRSDGSIGQFGGGTSLKQALIDLEMRVIEGFI